MKNSILYFAYGANSNPKMMQAITGHKHLVGQPAVLKGYKLYVQRLDQVPNIILPTAPKPLSPKEILRQWGENFETYTIKPAKDEDTVSGTIWQLTNLERELVRNWELLDFGWYQDKKGITATTLTGKKLEVETEILGDGQDVDREVNGNNYEPFLMPIVDFQRIAKRAREKFLSGLQNQKDILKTKEY